VHIVDFAIRSAAVVIWRAVPTGEAGLDQQGFGVGRNA
jgi:hypothetical protein